MPCSKSFHADRKAGSLVPRPLSEKSRRGLATVPYNGLSHAVCTVRSNEFSYVTLIAIYAQVGVVPFDKSLIMSDVAERKKLLLKQKKAAEAFAS